MNRIARLVAQHRLLAWLLLLLVTVASAWLTTDLTRSLRENERLSRLQTEAERRGIEVTSLTLNGNLMGAVAVLGLIDPAIKQEALGKLSANNPQVLPTLESIARSYDAEGVFVVAENGIAASSWDNSGKPSTGLNLKFRPYYQMAMQGMDNVYAAVSIARGDRALYFSAPVFSETTNATEAIGAVVARTSLLKLDNLLRDKADISLLLSPQGVVFASSRKEWIGHLAGTPTPERLKAIRELKQFGNMFENKEPVVLPMSVDGGIRLFDGKHYAVAAARVQWNDPFGDWQLVMMEDMARTVPVSERLPVGLFAGLLVFVLGALLNMLLSGQHRQFVAGEQLAAYSREQQAGAERKSRLAAAALKLQRSIDPTQLVQTYLAEAHSLLGALQGVVYVLDAGSGATLRIAGSYACAEALPETLAVGEGLLGQCAAERRLRVLATAADGFAAIRSGLGETRPAAILLAPILLNENLLGVAEIALLRSPDAEDQAQFEEMTALLAMNLEIIGRSAHTEKVLSATLAAEHEQAERLDFQQALIDTIPYPVFYKDADTRFLGFNRAYEETFNVRRADLIGKRVLDLDHLPEADRKAYQAEDEATIATAGSIRREMQIPFADGKLHDALYFVSGFRRRDGEPGGLVGTFMDISEIKDAERKLERLADAERFSQLALGREERILELKREVNALAEASGQALPYATVLVEPVGDHVLAPHPDYRTDLTHDGRPLQLADLVDLDELQKLFTAFCESVGIAAAIIDLQANVLASSRWQRACTDFHRINPDSCARCIESDTELSIKLEDGQDFTMYKCKNGMTDCASPIIVEGQHLANVFIGQFHLGPPDMEFFRQQARQFGYPEEEYLRAVSEAPVADETRLPVILGFLSGFARLISTMSLASRRADAAQQRLEQQADLLRRERIAAMSLAEDAKLARKALTQQGGRSS
jgi:PAS domain S-box-containing protein